MMQSFISLAWFGFACAFAWLEHRLVLRGAIWLLRLGPVVRRQREALALPVRTLSQADLDSLELPLRVTWTSETTAALMRSRSRASSHARGQLNVSLPPASYALLHIHRGDSNTTMKFEVRLKLYPLVWMAAVCIAMGPPVWGTAVFGSVAVAALYVYEVRPLYSIYHPLTVAMLHDDVDR